MITFKGINREYNFLKNELNTELNQVLKSDELITETLGGGKYPPYLMQFEKNFADYCGKKDALGTNSGTSALYLSLLASGVRQGDEVITVANTYIATALAISYTGAKPVFVDIDKDTCNINPDLISEKINDKTKAIIPVHLYGKMADMDKIMRIGKENNLKIIEDAAQAHGAEYKGKKAGAIGDFGCFSFYHNKNMGTYGDAGILIHDDIETIEKIDHMREFRGELSGKELLLNKRFPTRLSLIHAAVLTVKLRYLDRFNNIRREMAKLYSELLDNSDITLPKDSKEGKDVYFMYTIRTKDRDKLREYLSKKQIPAAIDYKTPLHLHPIYDDLGYKKGDFPEAEKSCNEVLSIPMHPFLKQEEIEYITKTIKEFYKNKV